VGGTRNAYKILVRKAEKKRPLGKPNGRIALKWIVMIQVVRILGDV
jgi:hypothetical protein